MLTNSSESKVISSLGWADGGSLWLYETASTSCTTMPLDGAKYITLHPGLEDHFAVLHHFEGARVLLTAHSFSDPPATISRAVIHPHAASLSGSTEVWQYLPTNYVAYLPVAGRTDFGLIRLHPADKSIEIQELSWYNEDYDKGYQGIVGAFEVPHSNLLIISVQRDSRPVIYDPDARAKVGTLNLADRHGNPHLHFRNRSSELWADDYDTLLKLEAPSWRITWSSQLQPAADGTRQFIGTFAFDQQEELCVIPRPFSRDVITLDSLFCQLQSRCPFDAEPIEAMVLSQETVVARDWKTGALLTAKVKPFSAA